MLDYRHLLDRVHVSSFFTTKTPNGASAIENVYSKQLSVVCIFGQTAHLHPYTGFLLRTYKLLSL